MVNKKYNFSKIVLITTLITATYGVGARNTDAGLTAIWTPSLNTSWQWQLSKPLNLSTDLIAGVTMYDIDLFDNSAATVAGLKSRNLNAVCYISAGTYENWRPDANQFPAAALGRSNGWAGEKWLDIRHPGIRPIMAARIQLCKSKGFDAIEVDNIDGYSNRTGFPLRYNDQLAYNTFLANTAHANGLSIALKNDVEQVDDLVNIFDWALNEQCFEYEECNTLKPFINAGKAVFNVEYNLSTRKFCPKANSLNFNSLKKRESLSSYRVACR